MFKPYHLFIYNDRDDEDARAQDVRTAGPLTIIAHRGASAYYPENTIASFLGAITMGADMVELDVQLTLDGEVVVFHDEDITRCTNGRGRIADHALVNLKKLDAGSWFDKKFSGAEIPLLADVLSLCKDRIAVNIEIKTEAVEEAIKGGIEEKCLQIVNQIGMREHVVFSSFDPRALRHLRHLDRQAPLAVLFEKKYHDAQLPSEIVASLGGDAFNCSRRELNATWLADLKRHSIPVNVYTVDDEKSMKRLHALGVDGIFTNKPDILRNVLDSLRQNREIGGGTKREMNMEENSAFKEKILSAPRSPGVYLMLDERARVIYVGKANDLKSRITSYLTGRDTRPMAPFLMTRVNDIDFITTTTEKEALILENNLIKKHRPRYNVILRDDKTYYHLSLNPKEPYPRLQLVRKRLNDDALYFGPYPSGMAAKETLRFVQQVFPLRTCRSRIFQLRTRPCLEYQIGRCLAPCSGFIDESAYRKLADSTVSFLQGRRRELISDLKKQMEEAAQDLNYEEAARLRDRIHSLEHALEKQNVDSVGVGDQDVLGFCVDQDVYQFCILFVRGGKLLGSKSFTPVKTQADKGEIISSVLKQYYDSSNIPDEIILHDDLPDEKVITEWLADQKEKKVRLTVPVRGVKKALLDMAGANARELLASDRKKEEQKTVVMRILQEKLSLTKLPRRIECYDISNISGQNAVGSMVTFQDGDPDKSGYRRFRIKAVDQPDDYGMMREVLKRRFTGDDALPDLVVVDGGKGQLNIALSVLNELKIKLDVIGLAKEERGSWRAKNKTGGKVVGKEDRVYLPRRKDAVYLSSRPAALSLLQRVRDEAHRFAVSYHHRLKQKTDFRSILDAIPDIGSKRKKILLTHFGSASQVQKSSLEDLQRIPGIGKELAEKIYSYLKKEQ